MNKKEPHVFYYLDKFTFMAGFLDNKHTQIITWYACARNPDSELSAPVATKKKINHLINNSNEGRQLNY